MDNQENENQMHNDPKNWKLGIFYFNPRDKRIIVPKRLSIMGITVNFANPGSILVLILLALLIIVSVKFSK